MSFIFKKALELEAKRIGTTAAVIYLFNNQVFFCNIGDSKIFLLRDKNMTQMSFDHVTLIKGHPEKKPALSQHLGMNPKSSLLNPYIMNDILCAGDIYLICSDGLTDMVSLSKIQTVLSENKSSAKCCRSLIKEALENGGRDNVSVMVIRVL